MKVVIFAGGLGTRLSEETTLTPKPMLKIGNFPILWHIMKIYSHYNINDFIICCGYKGEVIENYFRSFKNSNQIRSTSDGSTYVINFEHNIVWTVTLLDTGQETQTGGRLLRAKPYIDGTFCLTYGDGLADININRLINYHKDKNRNITVTGINPRSKYGMIVADDNNIVTSFKQKPLLKNHIVNAGFFVCEKLILELLESDDEEFETSVLAKSANEKQLALYMHRKFWACMDTQRDKFNLNELWNENKAEWKVW